MEWLRDPTLDEARRRAAMMRAPVRNVLPVDPDADRSRRAWLRCPNCDHGSACGDCTGGRNCATHWQYLLSNCGSLVHLQCPGCTHLWSVDTRMA